MKALSLWQPEASLVSTGAKWIETRSWKTNYRGRLLICSTKTGRTQTELWNVLKRSRIQSGLAPLVRRPMNREGQGLAVVGFSDLPFGKALCTVELYKILPTDDLMINNIDDQRFYGDFGPYRYAWYFRKIKAFKNPFDITGQQGLYEIPDSEIDSRQMLIVQR